MSKAVSIVASLACAACAPEMVDDSWFINAPGVLAVRADPAEVKPGADISLQALIAVPHEAVLAVPEWSYCTTPKPLSENNSFSAWCLDPALRKSIAIGNPVRSTVPAGACRTFGPEAPPGDIRARDPDSTGGYFQPLVVTIANELTVHLQRLQCALANASTEVASAFAAEYQPNTNPRLRDVHTSIARTTVSLDQIKPGAEVDVTITWESNAAETYRHFDLEHQTLVNKTETLQLSWHTDDGALLQPSTRPSLDRSHESTNTWLAPGVPGVARIWVVLRDSRGGLDFKTIEITVSD